MQLPIALIYNYSNCAGQVQQTHTHPSQTLSTSTQHREMLILVAKKSVGWLWCGYDEGVWSTQGVLDDVRSTQGVLDDVWSIQGVLDDVQSTQGVLDDYDVVSMMRLSVPHKECWMRVSSPHKGCVWSQSLRPPSWVYRNMIKYRFCYTKDMSDTHPFFTLPVC